MNRIMRERRKPFVSCLYVGLPPSNLFHNKYETIHAFLGANLFAACSRGKNFGGIQRKKNKSTKLDSIFFFRTGNLFRRG